MSSSDNPGCGCMAVLLLGAFIGFNSCNKRDSAKLPEPATGSVATYVPEPIPEHPVVSEPTDSLLSGGAVVARTAINMTNDMSDSAYVKVLSHGTVVATLYLRAGQSHRLSVSPGFYYVRYVTGPGGQWRGTDHHFGSYSEYFAGSSAQLDDGDVWSMRFYTVRGRAGTLGPGAPRMSREGF